MELGKKDVEHVARLARLYLTESEKQTFARQLTEILAYAGKLQQLGLAGVEPTAHAMQVTNVFREDVPALGLSKDKVLQNAPEAEGGFFKVPGILEE